MSLQVLYADKKLCVCIKPVGISSEAEGVPALLKEQLNVEQVYTVHRLDQGVGGVMIYALAKDLAAKLTEAFASGQVIKEYLCVTSPVPDLKDGICTDLLYHDKRSNKTFIVKSERKGVKKAELAWIRQETACIEKDPAALLRVALHSGRSHQIRIQLASRGWPLVGDGKYGSRVKNPKIALWSYRLAFRHPLTGEMMDYSYLPPNEKPWNLFSSLHG